MGFRSCHLFTRWVLTTPLVRLRRLQVASLAGYAWSRVSASSLILGLKTHPKEWAQAPTTPAHPGRFYPPFLAAWSVSRQASTLAQSSPRRGCQMGHC